MENGSSMVRSVRGSRPSDKLGGWLVCIGLGDQENTPPGQLLLDSLDKIMSLAKDGQYIWEPSDTRPPCMKALFTLSHALVGLRLVPAPLVCLISEPHL